MLLVAEVQAQSRWKQLSGGVTVVGWVFRWDANFNIDRRG